MTSTIETWMTREPVAIEPAASALAALQLMIEHGIRHLPVIDERRQVIGILSINDLRAALPIPIRLPAGLAPEERELILDYAVGEIMVHAPEVTHPHIALEEAARCLANRRIGCLPVVDAENELLGIFSEADALRALVASLKQDRAREALAELDTLAAKLRTERARIRRRIEDASAQGRTLSAEQHDLPMDDPERGSDLQQVALAESLGDLAARRLEAIDHALDRAALGTLGTCDKCGGGIPIARLRALPGTALCLACAREAEGGPPSTGAALRPDVDGTPRGRIRGWCAASSLLMNRAEIDRIDL